MKVEVKNINCLINHLNEQRALLVTLSDSHVKDVVQAQIAGIELTLTLLGLKVGEC
ncbi:hypothetical protein [Lysinibacillus agricola]|uniref:hypothetical protein n=1 Tax=Lysinibacillus agricola TaxID=2590012 RepID=UPI003C22FDBB